MEFEESEMPVLLEEPKKEVKIQQVDPLNASGQDVDPNIADPNNADPNVDDPNFEESKFVIQIKRSLNQKERLGQIAMENQETLHRCY